MLRKLLKKYPLMIVLGVSFILIALPAQVVIYSTTHPAQSSTLTAIPVVTPAPTQSSSTPSTTSLTGVWVSTAKDGGMTASVQNNMITVNWQTKDTTALYWAGTFQNTVVGSGPMDIESKSDPVAMDGGLMTSTDKTKIFTYKNGEISFKVTVMRVESTVRMKRS